MSKKAVAALIGVSTSTILTWEQGKFNPEVAQMKKIIRFLGYYPFPEPKTLAEKIQKYRQVNGLTLEEVGRQLNVDGVTVWTWEKGVYMPDKKVQDELKK